MALHQDVGQFMSISPEQCLAARALIGWSRRELAQASEVSDSTLFGFEERRRSPHQRTLNDIRRALENAGVTFVDQNGGGPGVRFTTSNTPPDQVSKPYRSGSRIMLARCVR